MKGTKDTKTCVFVSFFSVSYQVDDTQHVVLLKKLPLALRRIARGLYS
jgi:hypothetical protein